MTITPFRIVLAALLLAGAAAAQEAVAEPGVVVRGSGIAYGEPDRAVLELGVQTRDPDVRRALAEADDTMRRVRRALRAAGVAEEDFRTTTFQLWREEEFDRDGAPRGAAYRVTHLVEATVREVEGVGEVIAGAVEAGANQIGGVRFALAHPAELERRARTQAMEDARAKAEQLAEAAGARLGDALTIQETGGGGDPPMPLAMMEARAAGPSPVSAGQLAVRVEVTVRYALSSGPR